MTYEQHDIDELVHEALAEDDRSGSHFDAIGFAQFFPEDDPAAVRAAWWTYDEIVNGEVQS